MVATYSVVLRSCPDAARDAVAQTLSRAFSLKDTTSASITQSTPIVLLSGLSMEEAAVMKMVMQSLTTAGGTVEFTNADLADLPKVDWPRRPSIFKREISDHLSDAQINLPCPGCQQAHRLLDMLVARFNAGSAPHPVTRRVQEFHGSHLPEITPFSNAVLPPGTPSNGTTQDSGGDDTFSRLNELFPDDSSGFMQNDEAISNLLDRLLPDEEQAAPPSRVSGIQQAITPGTRGAAGGANGYAVFLAKITDEARRAKAVPLIAELAKISTADADALSKKPIIPVLKGTTKDEAEAAKQRFAKIGILARVKAPE